MTDLAIAKLIKITNDLSRLIDQGNPELIKVFDQAMQVLDEQIGPDEARDNVRCPRA